MINRIHLLYLPVLLIPFVVRLLPELRFLYPLGPDTPIGMYAMKYGPEGLDQQTNIFFLMIRGLGIIGVDPIIFFKTYPPVMFALICALFAIYARRTFGWGERSLLIFSLIYSFTPALLHLSWTTPREFFAIFLFALTLVLGSLKVREQIKWSAISVLYILIAFTHEFVFVVAAAILGLRAARLYYRKDVGANLLIPIAVVASGIFVYSLVRLDLVRRLLSVVFAYNYHPEGVSFSLPWQRFDWWLSLGVISIGFLIPIAILGFFDDDTLTPWFVLTFVAFTSFAISYFSFNQPERWLYLASIPISFYAANFVRKLDPRKISFYGVLAILAIQPLSMIGGMPLPLSLYADKRYGTFSDSLSPSIPPEQIRALQIFQEKVSTLSTRPSFMIVPNNSSFIWWAEFYFPQAGIYGSGTAQARSLMERGVNLLYVAYEGRPPSTDHTSTILVAYGGLDLYLVK